MLAISIYHYSTNPFANVSDAILLHCTHSLSGFIVDIPFATAATAMMFAAINIMKPLILNITPCMTMRRCLFKMCLES